MVNLRSLLILEIIFSLPILFGMPETHPENVPWVDRSDGICGYAQCWEHHDEIIRNTEKLHPEYSGRLSKSARAEYDVGDTLSFFTSNLQTHSRETVSALCQYKSERCYYFVGKEEWDLDVVNENDILGFYQAFEKQTPSGSVNPNQGILDILEQNIGALPNKAGDGYMYILIYDIKDQYDPGLGNLTYTAGYFSHTDQGNSAYSNQKDLIYIDCNPGDPSGNQVLSVVAHELQHLIHAGYDPDESEDGLWVNEGASMYAEVLCGFGLHDPTLYLLNPERSLTAFGVYKDNVHIDYAKVALWTTYLGQHFGSELIQAIVQNPLSSVEGVIDALEKQEIDLSFNEIFSNFVVANYINNPDLWDGGYYGYGNTKLPILPKVSKIHISYPVSRQYRAMESYSAAYYRFTQRDTTANLIVEMPVYHPIQHQIVLEGPVQKVEHLSLEGTTPAQYSLAAVGDEATEIIMMPANFSESSAFYYSVTSDLDDYTAPQIIAGPTESLPTGYSVTLFWETDEFSTSRVEYGRNMQYGSVIEDQNLVTVHQIALINLEPNTEYHYRVGSVDAEGNGPAYSTDFTLRTNAIASSTVVVTLQQSHAYGYQGRSMVHDPNGKLHLVYHKLQGDRRFVYHQIRSDNDQTWSDARPIDQSLYYGGMPSIAIDGNQNLHVVWHAQQVKDGLFYIYYSISQDGGETWSEPVQLSESIGSHDQLYAAISADTQDNLHVVWNSALYTDANTGDVYYTNLSDSDEAWKIPQMISQSEAHRCFAPTIDVDSQGKVYVLYSDGDFDSRTSVVYAQTSRDYTNWSVPGPLSYSGALYDGFVSLVIEPGDQAVAVFADNYTPGDIRILITSWQDSSWIQPVPATPMLSGNVSYPNISVDENDLYLVYENDMSVPALGKASHKLPVYETVPSLHKVSQENHADIFFSVRRNGQWSEAANLSGDAQHSQFPELPARIHDNTVDLIWMNEMSDTEQSLNYLELMTEMTLDLNPPRVISVAPEAGSAAPYFKEVLSIEAVIDQRILPDSLSPANVRVTSKALGLIPGVIHYETSQKKLSFFPLADISPDDSVTVTLTGHLSNEAGMGLDGNGNGFSEGSPTDDFTWTFVTNSPDSESPEFMIGVLQNPIFDQYMDLITVASEYLPEAPALSVDGELVALTTVSQKNHVYQGNYKLSTSGLLQISVEGKDLAGNEGTGSRAFTAQLILAKAGGSLVSPDQILSVTVPPSAFDRDVYMTIVDHSAIWQKGEMPMPLRNDEFPVYQVGPISGILKTPVILHWNQTPDSYPDDNWAVEFQDESGAWIQMPAVQSGNQIEIKTQSLGNFRVLRAEQNLPSAFMVRQNYPNPFNPETVITFTVPQTSHVQISIYDLMGRQVKTLIYESQSPGIHQIVWEGDNDQYLPVASGVYVARFEAAETVQFIKMVLIR